ncbi:MAG: ADYC domain-containing protein [Myxococcota bacterium]
MLRTTAALSGALALTSACAAPDAPTVETVNLGLQIENGVSLNGTTFAMAAVDTVFTQPVSSFVPSFDRFPIWTAPLFQPDLLNPYAGVGPNGESLGGVQAAEVTEVRLDGEPIESLVGMQLEGKTTDGSMTLLQVSGVAAGGEGQRDLLYYAVYAAEGPNWLPLCGTSPQGEPIPALAVPGRWNHGAGTATGGAWTSDGQTFNFACRGSSIAKCMEAGYRPWVDPNSSPGEIKTLAESQMNTPGHLQACVRMMRGDYCGDGTSHTVNGRVLEFWDTMALHERSRPDFTFEAAWTENGASILDLPRVLRPEGLPSCAYEVPWSEREIHHPNSTQLTSLGAQGHKVFSAYESQLRLGEGSNPGALSAAASLIEITRHQKCLSLHGGLAVDESNVQQHSCTGAEGQIFKFIPRGDAYEIRHELSGKCLEVAGSSVEPGGNVLLFECAENKANQLWKLRDNPATSRTDDFMLVAQHSGLCLDLARGLSAEGTNLKQWTCSNSNANQRFVQAVVDRTLTVPGGRIYEAEQATLHGAVVANQHAGASEGAFVDYKHASGDYVEFQISAPTAGEQPLYLRYALARTLPTRTMELSVNGAVIGSIDFRNTGGFSTWGFAHILAPLQAGPNTVRLTATGQSGPNLDYLLVPTP